MTGAGDPRDRDREERRRLLRGVTLYTAGLFAAAITVAVLGAALIAWMLTFVGLPFRTTWLSITVAILVFPLLFRILGGGGSPPGGPDGAGAGAAGREE